MTRRVGPGLLVLFVLLALFGPAIPARAHVGNDTSYRWVEPPEGLEANEPAQGRTAKLPASATELAASEVWTPDLQVVVAFRATRLPYDPTRRSVEIRITPVAPSSLAPPDSGRPDGNAYLIELDEALRDLTSAQLSIRLPHEPTALLYSSGGSPWKELDLVLTSLGTYAAEFQGNGHYLAIEQHPGGRGPAVAIAVVGLPLVTLVLWALAAAVARRRTACTP